MRWFWIALIMPLIAQAAPLVGVHGKDDRTTQSSADYPWSAVARINNVLGGWCTAVVIGPGLALTAAHCLWNKRRQRDYPPCALHFLAGYAGGEYRFHSLVVGFHKPPRVKGRQIPDRDWALLYLQDDPAPFTGTVPLHDAFVGVGTAVTQAGYSRDRRHRLSTHRNCRVLSNRAGLLTHDCDATFGDSGSPLLLNRDSGWSVAGVHVAVGQRMGVAVTVDAVREAIRHYRHPGGRIDAC